MRLWRLLYIGSFSVGLTVYPAQAGGAGDGRSPHAHAAPHGGLVETAGAFQLELSVDEGRAEMTLFVLGGRGLEPHPIPANPIAVGVVPAEIDDFSGPFELQLMPIPQDGEPPGFASRFVGRDAALLGLERFEASLETMIEGAPHHAAFEVNAASFHERFVCPMRCESGKTYARAGRCPACGMPMLSNREAHADHEPKHGGILFMAPDGWHHLEGVLHSPDEFRLYLYNDFTKPIAAATFLRGSWVEVASRNVSSDSEGAPVRLEFRTRADGDYLMVRIPASVTAPLEIGVRLRFEGRNEPELFNFSFDEAPK